MSAMKYCRGSCERGYVLAKDAPVGGAAVNVG